ncbi:MAG TPA: hypothetical protein VFE23_17090 [Usitatibacter sp.]|jgi:hypothetical protein|nr:hypothetical protein [Usitatibacter sp.]
MPGKTYTADEMRLRFPHLTETQVQRLVALLNRPKATIREIWAGEDQRGEPLELDADGLTRPMREVNAFAEENALGIPFPPRRRG